MSTEKTGLEVWENKEVEVTRTRIIKRLSWASLLEEIAAVFNFDRGLLYALKMLTINPAEFIRQYLDTRRDLIMGPLRYFIIIVGVTLFIATSNGFFTMDKAFYDGLQQGLAIGGENTELDPEKMKVAESLMDAYYEYFVKYQNVWSIITILFTSIFSFLFFKDSGYNFVENFVANTYLFTHTFLVFLLTVLFKNNSLGGTLFYTIVYVAYHTWAYKKLFGESWLQTSLKFLGVFIISSTLYFGVMLVGVFAYAVIQLR